MLIWLALNHVGLQMKSKTVESSIWSMTLVLCRICNEGKSTFLLMASSELQLQSTDSLMTSPLRLISYIWTQFSSHTHASLLPDILVDLARIEKQINKIHLWNACLSPYPWVDVSAYLLTHGPMYLLVSSPMGRCICLSPRPWADVSACLLAHGPMYLLSEGYCTSIYCSLNHNAWRADIRTFWLKLHYSQTGKTWCRSSFWRTCFAFRRQPLATQVYPFQSQSVITPIFTKGYESPFWSQVFNQREIYPPGLKV